VVLDGVKDHTAFAFEVQQSKNLDPADEENMILQNAGNYLSKYTPSHPCQFESSRVEIFMNCHDR
jgi:hypothetical protein